MKPQNQIVKGKRLEQKIASLIRRKGLDDRAIRMPGSGSMTHLPGDIYTHLPYSFEVKCREKVKLWEWWAQARDQAKFNKPPVLVVSGNFRPVLAVVEIETLLNLLKIEQDYLADIPKN